MNRIFTKMTAVTLAAMMAIPAGACNVQASSLSSTMPVAGVARVLNEGKSVTAVKADRILYSGKTTGMAKLASTTNTGIRSEDYVYTSQVSTIKETATTTDPALITVGAASAAINGTISENVVLDGSVNSELSPEQEAVIATVSGVSANEAADDGISDADLVDVTTGTTNQEEEDFTNLVIAQVNDYVNVRQEPSEDSDVVGKLYNKSVGDLLEVADGWYKIKSGHCTGYVKAEYVVTGESAQELAKEVGTRMAEVTTTTLYVRKEPSTDAPVISMVPIEDQLTVSEELDGWVKVSVEEGDGYVSTEFVKLYTDFVHAESKEEEEARLAKEEAARKAAQAAAKKAAAKKGSGKSSSGGSASYAPPSGSNGSAVANFALQFVGNPYVYGGTSLTNGADCSGFVMSVYRNFGVSLPHSSGGDRSVGYNVGSLANAEPGDIVCYSGHVAIYIGGGQIVHASTAATGIKVSNASYRNVLAVRRIF